VALLRLLLLAVALQLSGLGDAVAYLGQRQSEDAGCCSDCPTENSGLGCPPGCRVCHCHQAGVAQPPGPAGIMLSLPNDTPDPRLAGAAGARPRPAFLSAVYRPPRTATPSV